MTRKKLLYIGHSYHAKTRSNDFILTYLMSRYAVEVFLFDPYHDDMAVCFEALRGKRFDIAVLWQIMPSLGALQKVVFFKKAVFFPMYDGVPGRDDPIWYEYRHAQIINFCRVLHEELLTLGFSSHYIQYFPKPAQNVVNQGDISSVFFWQRLSQPNARTVETLLQDSDIKRLHLHKALDPQHTFVEPSADSKWIVEYSDWFGTKDEMLQKEQESAIYVAPRLYEGIGMSFLEAMAMGRCIIAPDYPTMNEYIVDGVNGYLYDPDHLRPICLGDIRKIQRNAARYIQDGFAKWEKEKKQIYKWMEERAKINRQKLRAHFEKHAKTIVYKLFAFLPLMKLKKKSGAIKTYLFGFLPFLTVRQEENRHRFFFWGIPILDIKTQKKEPVSCNEQEAEVSVSLQHTKNAIGRVLIVFHMNFLRRDQGVSNHVYAIARMLKELGYAIDLFSADLFGLEAFNDLSELNKHEKLIDDFYFADYKKSSKYEPSWDVSAADITWVNDFARAFFEKIVAANRYDYINIHYIQWANLLLKREQLYPDTKTVYTCHDSNFFQQFLSANGDLKVKRKVIAEALSSEINFFECFDKVMCISYDELLFWNKIFPDKEFCYFPYPSEEHKDYDDGQDKTIDVLYLAAYNPYNLHGLQWFVDAVCPHINKAIKITVCGHLVSFLRESYPEDFNKMKELGFNFIDYAQNLDDLYAKTKVVIVPLYEGTGMKIKTIEALSYNVPVVSRIAGVDGFPDKTNNGILVTDDPTQFAQFIELLLTDQIFCQNVKVKESQYFSKHFSRHHLKDLLQNFFMTD